MYPFKKTVIFFTLAPALPGIFIALYFAAIGLFSSAETMVVTDVLFATMGFGILSSILGLSFYGLPALLLAVIYACLEFRKCFKHIVLAGLAGGGTALMWSHLVPLDMKPVVTFAFGAASSLLIAIFVLPKQIR
ncbi:hypothetical protein J2T09_003040 [Neorhizobium huautlense]|uniref:Uncharacterized protein n=1 Tax=Neorhizobium huautlense TaxID=67774 RepID=A0ABT9PUY1_9HYPH|nr:hypothetical protein [Neorhizobium huautlense]MDP9838273.1 hypothetical protein [Neorhizobium huautlense]